MSTQELRALLEKAEPRERLNQLLHRYINAQFALSGDRPVARIPATEQDDDLTLSRVFDQYRTAVNALPDLLDEVERLRTENRALTLQSLEVKAENRMVWAENRTLLSRIEESDRLMVVARATITESEYVKALEAENRALLEVAEAARRHRDCRFEQADRAARNSDDGMVCRHVKWNGGQAEESCAKLLWNAVDRLDSPNVKEGGR